MDKTRFILILTLTAFRLFAQPTLPAANYTLTPIANAYSASWIYYATNPVSGLGFLNGASIPYVMTASNNVVVYVNAATNGFVTAAVTNGLATTNWVGANYYPTSNPSLFVTASVTNGLATTAYVNTATNGHVTAAITNGLATTNFVTSQGYVTATVTNGLATTNWVGANYYPTSNPSLFVTASVTNGLATTNWVGANYYPTSNPSLFVTASVTNGLATTAYVVAQAGTVGQNATNYVQSVTNLLGSAAYQSTGAFDASGAAQAATNGFGNIVTHSASELRATTTWCGTSGNSTINHGTTVYGMPNNSGTLANAYASAGTSIPVTRGITLTNLYILMSAAPGSGITNTVTLLTNGVASPLVASIVGTATTGSNTVSYVTIPAGTEISMQLVANGQVNAKWAWSFEGW